MRGGLCWAGECKGLSAEMFEVWTAGEATGITAGNGDNGVVCSLAG